MEILFKNGGNRSLLIWISWKDRCSVIHIQSLVHNIAADVDVDLFTIWRQTLTLTNQSLL